MSGNRQSGAQHKLSSPRIGLMRANNPRDATKNRSQHKAANATIGPVRLKDDRSVPLRLFAEVGDSQDGSWIFEVGYLDSELP